MQERKEEEKKEGIKKKERKKEVHNLYTQEGKLNTSEKGDLSASLCVLEYQSGIPISANVTQVYPVLGCVPDLQLT